MRAVQAAMLPAMSTANAQAEGEKLVVNKSPSFGCCAGWAKHMSAAGFKVETNNVSQDALLDDTARLGIAPVHSSCHTAVVDGYIIEGHVPAEDVARLLKARPEAICLAAPGMPISSPGMEMGIEREPYDVLLITKEGLRAFSGREWRGGGHG